MFTEEKAMTPTNIKAGFKKTGIFPLDEHIFDECDLATKLQTLMRYRFFCQIIHLTTFQTC